MKRREYLGILTIATIGVSGCTGSSDGSGQEPEPKESGQVSSNSADNYVEVEQGETIRIEVIEEEKSAGGGTLVRLYHPDGEEISEEDVDDERTVTHQAEQGGEYRVIVFTGGTASYEIYVESE